MAGDLVAVRRIQRTTIAGVLLLALIAAVVSFRHMHELCLRHGEDHLAAVLIPIAVDGLIVVASMSILLANRSGSRGGLLAWSLLVVGSLASLGANVAIAESTVIGRIIAAWPSLALIGSYELLMSQIRRFEEGQAKVKDLPALTPDPAADAEADPAGPQDDQEEDADLPDGHDGNSRALQRPGYGRSSTAMPTATSQAVSPSRGPLPAALDGAASSRTPVSQANLVRSAVGSG
ncbi:DUF2637 domain-containing protein [Microbispora cellulosiformans]|uniref:DUF2637 domain-containing protein n=1 Tax=Microbispora cellulosiformans TaxID=2614688 RepID=A0A5J5K0S3_9ACTN|nr:DUF2637 domain-containing protein [Microbispora cellulosiformans]KAA9376252.1 DUF2637 domain-containing protein [Microbispora cellulosiformans]